MRVLVTGSAGFIGSNLCNELARQGHDVNGLDNLHLGVRGNLDKYVHFREMDVRESEFVRLAMEDIKPEIVFHLAAASSSPMFNNEEVWGLDNNIMGFVNVMHYARKSGAKRVIYASSSSLYNENSLPWSEDMNINPVTFYEASFRAREEIANAYYEQYEFPSIAMRFFSVYGPNEKHKGQYANNLTQFLWAMQKDERPVIYGDGDQTRDFIHVEDVVRALILAIKCDPIEYLFNVGTGLRTSFNDIINLLNTHLHKNIEPKYIDNPIRRYVRHTQADISRAYNDLGFKAAIDLDTGISKLITAYQ